MEPARLFEIVNTAVLPAWLLLLAAPRWNWTQRLAGFLAPAALSVTYLAVLATHWGEGDGGGFGSLAEVTRLFQSPWILLGGWIHYLAFDLFIGAWQTRDSFQANVPRPVLFVTLPLTLMFGPVGLLLYLAVRTARQRSVDL